MNTKRNYFYNVLSELITTLIPLVTTPYVTRILGTDGMGAYNYVLTVASYFVLFANFGIKVYGSRCIAQVRDDPDARNRTFSEIFRLQISVSVPVYDDFGHHPSEVKTTLEGAKRMGYARLRCVYQPHTYSRTVGLFEEFCHAFDAADEVIFADIYAAREQNTFGVSSSQLAERIPHASYQPDWDALLAYLLKTSREGDLLLIMGAGDISRFAERIACRD